MGDDPSPAQAWVMAILLWVAVAGTTATEIAPASVLTLIAGDLGIGSTGVSWLVSIFLLGMVVCSLPAGFVLDRVDNRHVIPVTALVFFGLTLAAVLAAQAERVAVLTALRLAAGMVSVVLWTAAVTLTGAAFGPTRQGTSIGFMTASIPGGFAIAHTIGPVVTDWVGWEWTFAAFAVLTVGGAVAFWLFTRGLSLQGDVATPTRDELLQVLGNRWVWVVSTMAFAAFSLNMIFNNWLPTYLVEEFGVGVAAGGVFAAVFPAIGAVARFSSGTLSDRLFRGRRRPIVLGSFVVITPLIVIVANVRTIALLLGVLVVAGFVTQMGLALLVTYVRELVAETVAATSLSVLNLVGLTGAFSAPVLTGLLIDATGSYTAAFAYATVLGGLGIVLAWVAPEPS